MEVLQELGLGRATVTPRLSKQGSAHKWNAGTVMSRTLRTGETATERLVCKHLLRFAQTPRDAAREGVVVLPGWLLGQEDPPPKTWGCLEGGSSHPTAWQCATISSRMPAPSWKGNLSKWAWQGLHITPADKLRPSFFNLNYIMFHIWLH